MLVCSHCKPCHDNFNTWAINHADKLLNLKSPREILRSFVFGNLSINSEKVVGKCRFYRRPHVSRQMARVGLK